MKKTRFAFDLLEKEIPILHKASSQKLLVGLHFDNYEDLIAFSLNYDVTDEIAGKTYFSGSNGTLMNCQPVQLIVTW